ncbi:sulfatase-like hydrolase/transferase [Catenuloplanes japonicus]|uniref:sulfatase-like hydrolase/transferase n=1 Tax=Catenuloplanes japonicus TaxID=33876 RepID=UPI000AFE6464|nr:sulfatase-like hydrolase/transferase [Catenuloplanes japonicus]
MITVMAGLLVVVALLLPNQPIGLTAGAFLRIPVEALIVAVLLLVLPGRARTAGAIIAGLVVGLLLLVKLADLGFFSVYARQMDLVLDWSLADDGITFLTGSIGRAGAIAAVVLAVALLLAVPLLMIFALLRLGRAFARHQTATTRGIALLTTVWLVLALVGNPVADRGASTFLTARTGMVNDALHDREAFAAAAAVDAFGSVPPSQLLTGLRGKDVLLTFVESYGRSAVEDPAMSAQVGAVLADGERRLTASGFAARSGWLTSPTFGGYSWLAHSTFQSGLRVDNQQRYRTIVSSDRLTLTESFRRAGWATVGVAPANTYAWPEGDWYGFDKVYDSRNLGYAGPKFGWTTMPDQYTLTAFEKLEHGRTDRGPMMAELDLLSSHFPWDSIPEMIDWNAVGDGAAFAGMPERLAPGIPSSQRDAYRTSIEYSLTAVFDYLELHGNENTVVIYLGDHQPAPTVTGPNASHDVPITIVAKDPAVLDRIASWNWSTGLKPAPDAPVWPMESFRDHFLSAFATGSGS